MYLLAVYTAVNIQTEKHCNVEQLFALAMNEAIYVMMNRNTCRAWDVSSYATSPKIMCCDFKQVLYQICQRAYTTDGG